MINKYLSFDQARYEDKWFKGYLKSRQDYVNFVYDLVVWQSSARCISLVLHDPIDEKKNDDLVSSTTGSSALHCKERKISFLSLS